MSVYTPTAIPRPPIFPVLLPKSPEPYPTPLPKGVRVYARLNARRDLVKEMDDLSEEEAELDEVVIMQNVISMNGFTEYCVPRSG